MYQTTQTGQNYDSTQQQQQIRERGTRKSRHKRWYFPPKTMRDVKYDTFSLPIHIRFVLVNGEFQVEVIFAYASLGFTWVNREGCILNYMLM